MMVIHPNNGAVTFRCPECINKVYPCLSCSMERSVYDLGFRDGSVGNPYEATGFNEGQRNIYTTGYTRGREVKNG